MMSLFFSKEGKHIICGGTTSSIAAKYLKKEIKTDFDKELTAHFMIFSIPATLIFFDSKEFKRYGRNMSVPLFIEEIERPYDLMCE